MWAGGVRGMGFSAIVSCRNCPGKPWIQSQTPIEELARLLIYLWNMLVIVSVVMLAVVCHFLSGLLPHSLVVTGVSRWLRGGCLNMRGPSNDLYGENDAISSKCPRCSPEFQTNPCLQSSCPSFGTYVIYI